MKTVGKWMWTLPVLAAGLFLLGSCVKEASESVTIDETVSPEVTAVIAADETRTAVDADLNVLWEKGDQISVFLQSQKNRCYELVGEGGEASGTFKYKSGAFYADKAAYYYGVYPYDPGTTLYSDGTLSVTVPAVQPYREDSFTPGVNVMAAASEDHSLSFKNVCGYVQLKLYGTDVTVKSLVLKGNDGEEIAGSGEVLITPDAAPELTLYPYGSATEITVEADTPVTLGETEEDATVFWFVVAPTVFEDGFTVQVIGEDGEVVFEKATEQEVEIVRNQVYRLKAVEIMTEAPAFTADITWTYAEDAEVDHNMYYDTGEKPNDYSRKALPLEFPEGVIEKIGSKVDGKTPTSVTVTCINNADEEVVDEYIKVSNFALKDGKLTVDVEDFEWDETYTVTAEFTGLTLTGTLTTTDRNRERVTLPGFEYTFDIGKLDDDTGFGYIKEAGYYRWVSAPMNAAIFKAFAEKGVINVGDNVDFAYDKDKESFSAKELTGKVAVASPADDSDEVSDYVGINSATVSVETKTTFKTSVLKDEIFNSGVADANDPDLYKGNKVFFYFTTYIGEEVKVPITFNFRYPHYDSVEMGPDGLKWATMNVGADKPEDNGDYFAWGETEPKTDYSWSTYKFNPSGDGETFTKYTTVGDTLEAADDAARANWGGEWRMPTAAEWTWLLNNCTWTKTTQNGVTGALVTAANGNSIFLPSAGRWWSTNYQDDYCGNYWSSNLTDTGLVSAQYMSFYSKGQMFTWQRDHAMSVRPVCD